MSRVLSQRAINRALLARQMLLDRTPLPGTGPGRAAQVVRTIEHLVGLQAQAPFPPYYGLHSRLAGFQPGDLAALLTGPGSRCTPRRSNGSARAGPPGLAAEAERVLAFAAPGAAHQVRFAPLAS